MKKNTSKGKQKFICEIAVLGRALTKTFIHIPFVVTPYGFMISFGEWALRERCSRHPSSKRYHGGCVKTLLFLKNHKEGVSQSCVWR